MENNLTQLILTKEVLQTQKDMLDQRGKKFARLFRSYVKMWAAYFDRQVKDYIAFVENNPQMFVEIKKDANGEFDQENIDRLAELYMLGMEMQDADIQQQLAIGLKMDIKNKYALDYAKTRAGEMISQVNETTQKEIQAIIEQTYTEGLSMQDIVTRITEKFSQYSEYRANLIAVMETGMAYEQGKKQQYQEYANKFGVTGYKKSFTQGDSRVRPTHQENAAAGWIRATEMFPGTGTDTAPHGFNCRCTVTYSLYDPDQEKPQFF